MAEEMLETPPNIFDRLWDSGAKRARGLRLQLATRQLEKRLSDVLERMNEHSAQGKPPGSECFVILWKKADGYIADYCADWEQTRESVFGANPNLYKAEAMTRPVTGMPVPMKLVGGILLATILAIVLGVVIGLATVGEQATVQVFHRVFHISGNPGR